MSLDRYDPLRAVAAREGLDAVALVPGANFRRLFNKDFHQNERALVVIVPVKGMPAAVVPNLELASFALINFEGEVFDWRDEVGPGAAFAALAKHMPLKRLGVEGQRMRVMEHHALKHVLPDLEIVDAHRAISALRLHKTDNEIALLKRAIAISESALEMTFADVRAGLTETQVESILVQNLFRCGAEELAFDTIVAAGDNSARPHAKARADYSIKAGDALMFDFGARVGGLCADITRTVFVEHCPDEARALYDTVKDANAVGRALAAPGVSAHDIDDAVIGHLERSPYATLIRSKTGHGLGRDVHEDPYIMRGNHTLLEPGMVFTVEPGLYKAGAYGVRIEDDVLVTDEGACSLTAFTRDLTVVK